MSDLLQIEYMDDSFTIEKSEAYQLLVELGVSWHRLAVLDSNSRLLLLLSWQKDSQEERVQQLLNLPYFSRRLALFNQTTLLMPDELYDTSQHLHYFNFFLQSKDTHTLLVDAIPNLSVQCIYTLDAQEWEVTNKQFQTFQIKSRSASLLSLLDRTIPKTGSSLSIHFEDHQTDYTYWVDGQLRYHQSFPGQTTDEFNYFFLNVVKMQEIALADTKIWISGNITEESEDYTRLKKYSHQVEYLDLSGIISCNHYQISKNAHAKLPLFGLLCA